MTPYVVASEDVWNIVSFPPDEKSAVLTGHVPHVGGV
jgi:hypothetical protein